MSELSNKQEAIQYLRKQYMLHGKHIKCTIDDVILIKEGLKDERPSYVTFINGSWEKGEYIWEYFVLEEIWKE